MLPNIWRILLILLILWRCLFLYDETKKLQIRVVLDSPSSELAQLYYDRGFGFCEIDSTVVSQKQSPGYYLFDFLQNAAGYEGYNNANFYFEIPKDEISSLRFAPLGIDPKPPIIKKVSLVDGLGNLKEIIFSASGEEISDKSIQTLSVNTKNTKTIDQSAVRTYDIPLNNFLSLQSFNKISIGRYVLRVLFEILILAVLVSITLLGKKIYFSTSISAWISKTLSYIRVNLLNTVNILLVLSAMYLYLYPVLNDSLFPLLFEKLLICVLLVIIFRNFRLLPSDSHKIAPFICCVVLFIIYQVLSTYMHYSALQDDNLLKYVSINDGRFGGTLIDTYRATHLMLDRKVTSDQAVFALFFPLLILVSFTLFCAYAKSWRVLLFLPLIFLPDCLLALYQSGGIRLFEINDAVGFSGDIVSFRCLLFLMFPLLVLGVILSRNMAIRAVYLLAIPLFFLLLQLTYGRGAILGILTFILVFPMIWIWVQGLWRKNIICSYLGVIAIVGMVLSAGVLLPKYQSVMSAIITERLVNTLHAVFDKKSESTYLEEEPRPEMQRQALRLLLDAPIAGWGPAAFQINSQRIRYLNGDKPGIAHVMTGLYLQIATNFGLLGFIVMGCLHGIPMWMVWRVRKNITDIQTRWAVGIIVTTVLILSLLFTLNPNISVPATNWIYTLYLGYLMSVALKHDYKPAKNTLKIVSVVGFPAVLVFVYGSYLTSYGKSGYETVQDKLLHTIVDDYTVSGQKLLWDSKRLAKGYQVANRLIHTRANPFHHKYTTQVISLQAKSDPVSIAMNSDLLCIETEIAEQSNPGNIYMTVKIFLGEDSNGETHVFRSGGKHLLYYKIPAKANGAIEARVEVDMWKALPYHEDYRDSIDQIYIPYHKDYHDLGTIIKVSSYGNGNRL
ncbi:MAG TPA: hypothetical protein DEG92_07690 [Rikenellaceae bacterium]|nr:hypothetical protein [Rikenellaceae bacterium]